MGLILPNTNTNANMDLPFSKMFKTKTSHSAQCVKLFVTVLKFLQWCRTVDVALALHMKRNTEHKLTIVDTMMELDWVALLLLSHFLYLRGKHQLEWMRHKRIFRKKKFNDLLVGSIH